MNKELFNNHKYIFCAGLSTLSLLMTSFLTLSISNSVKELSEGFEPISKWANSQNECITKTYRIDGINTQGIPDKVWSCNGGGD